MTAFERIVDKLRDEGHHVKESGTSKAMVQCPAHEDRHPSLSLTGIEGQALVYCHGGCETDDVLATLGMTTADLFDEPRGSTYRYFSSANVPVRTVMRSPSKDFKQKVERIEDSKRTTLYRLPQVVEAVEAGETIYLVEGEKDVHALESVEVTATTSAMGASNVGKADLRPLYDAQVVAVVDNDDAGKKWAGIVKDALDGKAKTLTFVEAKTGKDAADHIAAGHDVKDLVDLDVEEDVPLRRARITWASQIEPEPVVWAWETDGVGRIPTGSLSVAAGREGTGKSSFGIWLAAHITRGTLPGDFHGTPRPIFYVAVEDSWKHTLAPRLKAAGADLSKVGRFDVINVDDDEMTLSLPHDNALLEKEIRHHGVALVVIDPLMSAIGAQIDTHREREVRSALDPLAKIADRTDSILLGIAHFNKGGGTDAASLITGSGAFKNVPRSVFGFARDESDDTGSRVMSQVKNSLGRDDLPSLSYVIESAEVETKKGIALTGRFAFTGESDRSVAEILRDSRRDPEDLEEAKDAASWIHGYLEDAGGEAPAKDVITAGKAVGHSEKTLKNARKKVADTERSGFGKEGVWTWVLRVGPSIGPVGPTNQKPGPTGPTPGPTDEGGPPDNGALDDHGATQTTGPHAQDALPEEEPPLLDHGPSTPQGHATTTGHDKTPAPTIAQLLDEVDDRPQCDTCNKRLGKDEAKVGTCLWCQRIATANQRARSSA